MEKKISDLNTGIMEGVITHISPINEKNSKKTLDVTIKTQRINNDGAEMFFMHNFAIGDSVLERSMSKLVVGEFIRIRYHLQESTYAIDENRSFRYSRGWIDYVE